MKNKSVVLAMIMLITLSAFLGCSQKNDTNTRQVPILMYHDFIADGEPNAFEITAAAFEEHLRALSEAGYVSVNFTDLINYVNGECELPEKCVVISTDDGYTGVIDIALPLCEKYGMKLTCAVVGDKVNANNHFVPDESMVGRIELTSHTYGLHVSRDGGYNGVNMPLVGDELKAALTDDTDKLLLEFGEIFPEMGKILVYPFGAHTDEIDKIYADLGYDVTVTVEQGCAEIKRGDADSLRKLPRYQVYPHLTGEDIVDIVNKKR